MCTPVSLLKESFPPKPKFSVDDIPDLTGRIIIVTGGNTGIGKETVKALLSHNAKVYMAARSKEKAEAAIQELKETTGKEAIFLPLDLADLPTIKASAEEFLRGVMTPPMDQLTKQGYDLQFGTNTLGHIYFTKLLLPALFAGAESSHDGKARVVNTSSSAHLLASGLDFTTLKDGRNRRKMSATSLYSQSKFGNVVFSNELARRYGDKGIVSVALNPGNLQSDLQRHLSSAEKAVVSLILHPTARGALTQLYAGTTADAAELNGK
ncbi:hypothetical protein H0H93_016401, partial [Arthromyces matolae]